MQILLVAATEAEIQPVLQFLEENYTQSRPFNFQNNQQSINVLITGVGMVATAYQLGKTIASQPFDFVINAGIAGAINRDLEIGDVVQVTADQFFGFGAEDKDGSLLSIFDLGFIQADDFPYQSGLLKTAYLAPGLKSVNGITVQKVHGSSTTIQLLNPANTEVESMEGAAFMLVALTEKIRCCQIRSISNYVEERNKANWDIKLAIHHLNEYLLHLLSV